MGDNIIIRDIKIIKNYEGIEKYQIDIYNETRNEWYRTFIDKTELKNMLNKA